MLNKVLICDDDVHILKAAEFKLKRAGFDVQTAFDGEDAYETILRDRPDILVTDCQMPRLDGLGLARRIRSNDELAELPIVMLTAKGLELSAEELRRDLGIVAVLPKPFSPRELHKCVAQILETGTYQPTTTML